MGDSIVLLYVFVSLLVLAAAAIGFFLGYLFFVDRHRDLLCSPAASTAAPSRQQIAESFMRSLGYSERSIGQHARYNTPDWERAEVFADTCLLQLGALSHAAKKGA